MSVSVGASSRNLVLAAMIFAVSMTFIDQTIVSIAVPQIQDELGLSSTGIQWVVNAYLLTLAAFFALGGRLSDTVGHRKILVIGVLVFVVASTMCGLTPDGAIAEPWIVTWRGIQGIGGALLFPAALAIVVNTFELRSRGKALALFFGIAGGLTALGPLLGGYLTEWTWRAIFWVNIPVAIIALILIAISKPETAHKPGRIDYRGAALIGLGVALSVFGFQQSAVWGWSDPRTGLCIVAGFAILVLFVLVQLRTEVPLIQMRIFKIRAFFVENLVLGIAMLVFVPVFFFASLYSQVALNQSASEAGIFLMYFFLGYVVAAQIGGAMLDKGGAKRPVVLGCALAAVGFALWAEQVTELSFSSQQWYIILAGAGIGMMLGPASTDAVNRASDVSYGEATGITQTIRNYAAALGMGILGTIMVTRLDSRITDSLVGQGVPADQAAAQAADIAQATHGGGGGSGTGSIASIPDFIRLDFAYAVQSVFYVMAAIMAVATLVAIIGLRSGVQPDLAGPDADEPSAAEGAGKDRAPGV